MLPNIKSGVSYRTSQYEWPTQPLVAKYLPLWKQACDIVDQHLASRPLGEWISLKQTFKWKKVMKCSSQMERKAASVGEQDDVNNMSKLITHQIPPHLFDMLMYIDTTTNYT